LVEFIGAFDGIKINVFGGGFTVDVVPTGLSFVFVVNPALTSGAMRWRSDGTFLRYWLMQSFPFLIVVLITNQLPEGGHNIARYVSAGIQKMVNNTVPEERNIQYLPNEF
jgi:hypothetical protein